MNNPSIVLLFFLPVKKLWIKCKLIPCVHVSEDWILREGWFRSLITLSHTTTQKKTHSFTYNTDLKSILIAIALWANLEEKIASQQHLLPAFSNIEITDYNDDDGIDDDDKRLKKSSYSYYSFLPVCISFLLCRRDWMHRALSSFTQMSTFKIMIRQQVKT